MKVFKERTRIGELVLVSQKEYINFDVTKIIDFIRNGPTKHII